MRAMAKIQTITAPHKTVTLTAMIAADATVAVIVTVAVIAIAIVGNAKSVSLSSVKMMS
jgi:hypothetical protein